jgi:hypothetical protein|tara:strand:+ start:1046 stop:1321 length:276 start_codon:yes stop_codon:yes gene_type:complete
MINYQSKEWNNLCSPIFKSNDKWCEANNYYDDVWNWSVADDLAKKIIENNLVIDKDCIEFIFEKFDTGVQDLTGGYYDKFKNYLKENEDEA